jgi:hypothetical protein
MTGKVKTTYFACFLLMLFLHQKPALSHGQMTLLWHNNHGEQGK